MLHEVILVSEHSSTEEVKWPVTFLFSPYWAWHAVGEVRSDQFASHVQPLHLFGCRNQILQILLWQTFT